MVDTFLRSRAADEPGGAAILAPGRVPLTYAGLCAQVEHAADRLQSMGVTRGSRVAIVLPNGPEMAVAFLAVSSVAAAAPLNPAYRGAEFDFYLSDLNARAVIVMAGDDTPARAVARDRGIPVIELSAGSGEAGVFALRGGEGASIGDAPVVAKDDVALVLHTSGTTSRPKMVPLTRGNLAASASSIRDFFALGPADRCLNVMPLFHIHGLVGALLSTLAGGGSVVCTPGFQTPRFLGWLEEFRPTWYTAVPTMHQAVLGQAARQGVKGLRSTLRFIRSCSAPLPPQVMAELEGLFGVPVLESYGMTEASHQMTSNPLPPRPRKPGSVGVTSGPEVAIMDEAGAILPPGAAGEVVIRGPGVTRGYEGRPEANAAAFTHGWFRTGDQGYLDEGGYLFLTGRIKELINRGGEKIAPREIDEALLDHPAVAQALAFAVPDAGLGEEVAAAVVLRGGASATERELREFVARRLAHYKVPRRVILVSEIPKGPTGKPHRIGLADELGLNGGGQPRRPAEPGAHVAPRDDLEKALAGIWTEVSHAANPGVRDNLLESGADSILATLFIGRVSAGMQVEVPLISFLEEPTIEGVAALVRRAREGQPAQSNAPPSVVCVRPGGRLPPLFCVPFLTGDLSEYGRLAGHLPPGWPVYGFRAPEFGEMRPGYTVAGLASRHVRELLEADPKGPYYLCGNCFGGLVAYEMARQLEASGRKVALLALFDCHNPRGAASGGSVSRRLRHFLRRVRFHQEIVMEMGGNGVAEHFAGRFRALIRTWRLAAGQRVFDHCVRTGWPVPARLRAIRYANVHARDSYVPGPYGGHLVLFRTRAPRAGVLDTPSMGWEGLVPGVELHDVPGTHYNLFAEPQIGILGAAMRECLERAYKEMR